MPRAFDRYPGFETPIETAFDLPLSPALGAASPAMLDRAVCCVSPETKMLHLDMTTPSIQGKKDGVQIAELELPNVDSDEENPSAISPAATISDWTDASLDELSDEDTAAFLGTKGTLSHWPTPTLPTPADIAPQPVGLLSLEPEKSLRGLRALNIDRVLDSPYSSSTELSDEDSLNDLSDDELDALFAARGALSRWPTPPSSAQDDNSSYDTSRGDSGEEAAHNTMDTKFRDDESECDDDGESEVDHLDVATVLARSAAPPGANIAWSSVLSLEALLIRADLPADLYALALNILSQYTAATSYALLLESPLPRDPNALVTAALNLVDSGFNTSSPENALILEPPLPRDLNVLVTAALNLAAVYIEDHTPSLPWWLKYILCDGTTTVQELERVKITMLKSLGWRLHDLCNSSSLAAAWQRFERRGDDAGAKDTRNNAPKPLMLAEDHGRRFADVAEEWSEGFVVPKLVVGGAPFTGYLPLL